MSLRRLPNESDARSITVFAGCCAASAQHRVDSKRAWISYLQKKRDASIRRIWMEVWMEEYNIY
ncbi:hypothetical protein EBB54_16165 [Schaedlerella arabinosiphila]|uniref:Uncharacterized protein n=1 Tax=Schaedlerella arabinosiphila TaxID=2044587 RepID=A0A426DJA0_9FIRM|nr:hypothetical protein EBB54_16165 [Schaedlerella arabinosiphila]